MDFESFYERYYSLVCFVISRYVQNKQDIEEIADDVFISLFQHFEKVDFSNKNLKYYITKTATNMALNFLKTKKNLAQVESIETIKEPSSSRGDFKDIVSILKEGLSEEELNLILDHDVYGYPLKDLASQKGQSPNTVKSKYRRAIKKARSILKGRGYKV